MSYGRRFNPATRILSLENADTLAALKTDGDVLEGTTPPVEPTPEATPAVDTPPADVPAGDTPPADTLPVDAPVDTPVDTPVATPAADPAAEPALEVPPVEEAPVVDPVAAPEAALEVPADDTPPAGDPAAAVDTSSAVVEAPVVDTVAAVETPAEVPPVEATPAEVAPVDVPSEDLSGVEEVLESPETMELEDSFDQTTEQADEASGSADNLEAIATQLEGTLEEGGATPQTIAIAQIAVESYVKQLTGRKSPKNILLSLESYGGLQSRRTATRLAMENIREVAAQAWAKIVEAVKKAIEFLKGMLTHYTQGFGKFKEQAAKLREAIRKNGANAKDGAIKVKAGVAARLQLGGQFTKEALLKGLDNSKKFLAKILKFLGVSNKTVDSIDLSGAATSGEFPTIDTSMLGQATRAFGSQKEQVEEGIVTVTNLEPLPGNATAYVTGPDVQVVGEHAYRVATSQDVNIVNNSAENEAGEDVQINGLSVADLDRVVTSAEELIKMAEEVNAAAAAAVEVESRLLSEAEQASKSGDESAIKRAGAKLQGFVSRASRALAKPASVVLRYMRNVISSVLIMVGSALSSLGIVGQAPAAAPAA